MPEKNTNAPGVQDWGKMPVSRVARELRCDDDLPHIAHSICPGRCGCYCLYDVSYHLTSVGDPTGGEHPGRDHASICADNPVEPDPQLVGACPVMGVQEQDLRDRIA